MAYIWAVLAAIQPAFQTVTDAADPGIRALMKTPATLADLGLAALVVFALRDRPRWAVLGALAVLFVPAVPYVSAWWGQYESIFVLSGLGAAIAATRGRNGLAAVLIAVSLMHQAAGDPAARPVRGVVLGHRLRPRRRSRRGHRAGEDRGARAGHAGRSCGCRSSRTADRRATWPTSTTTRTRSSTSCQPRAWNAWWLLQEAANGGEFIADDVAFLGPFTLRHVGYVVTGLLSLVIAWRIIRDPRPRTLVLGLAASVLVFFSFMTQMHERYAYAALVLLVLLLPERRIGWLWVAFAVVFTLNLLAAIPPTPQIAELLPVAGVLGVVGSLAMLGITLWLLADLRRPPGEHPLDRSATTGELLATAAA